jgi:hypothetical protein
MDDLIPASLQEEGEVVGNTRFWLLVIGNWNLFVIWDLLFGIYKNVTAKAGRYCSPRCHARSLTRLLTSRDFLRCVLAIMSK